MGLSVSMYRSLGVRARRRSDGERRALAPLRRGIAAADGLSRRKYLRDFNEAFTTFDRTLTSEEVLDFAAAADVLLIGDYHALTRSQEFVAEMLRKLAGQGRKLQLGVEFVFTRDQHLLDEWQRREISDRALRQRLRFNSEWGYAWEPLLKLLQGARELQIPISGLDCPPRGDLRRISARDRHAADRIAQLRAVDPERQVVVLFGESHLAPTHLPADVQKRLAGQKVRTILQNYDQLYWPALQADANAVQITKDICCVFNATPLEKYKAYRDCIERWRGERRGTSSAGLAYDLIDALLEWLNVERYSESDEHEPRYLVDLYPEVADVRSLEAAEKLLSRRRVSHDERRRILLHLAESGSVYIAERNLLLAYEIRLPSLAEAVASFVHHACRRMPALDGPDELLTREDHFYTTVLEIALRDFGARVLHSARPLLYAEEILDAYDESADDLECSLSMPYRDCVQMLDFLTLHRDYERHQGRYAGRPVLLSKPFWNPPVWLGEAALRLGHYFGADLYEAYLAGAITKRTIRALFFRRLNVPGSAGGTYMEAVHRIRHGSRRTA